MEKQIKLIRSWDGHNMKYSPRMGTIDFCKWVDYNTLNSEIMLFTGILDKTKTGIFEGDIIKAKHWYGDMDELDEITHVKIPEIYLLINGTKDSGIDESTLEVIGNIYQNQELLD